ncbi:MAG: glycosyltransferase family 2 protein [Actinobacteria bacterium]|nr:glycosyltransferase family 2 protein [Actinomycetota bacterium]
MRIKVVVSSSLPSHVAKLTAVAVDALESDGFVVECVEVPRLGLPDVTSAEHEDTFKRFVLTPGALIESWRIARHLTALTQPGDIVLIPDHRGWGGIFALEQALSDLDECREVWTLSGASVTLASLDMYKVTVGEDDEAQSAIDWELVQYRFSSRVIAMSEAARVGLSSLGIETVVLDPNPVSVEAARRPKPGIIALPEAVARCSHTPEIMRAIVEYLVEYSAAEVVVSTDDADDVVWKRSTWESIPGLDAFGERIWRDPDPCDGASVIVLGNPFSVPPEDVISAYRQGASVLAPAGSLAIALLPSARPWETIDDLVQSLTDPDHGRVHDIPASRVRLLHEFDERWTEPTRARRVSVGIPVHGDVSYLESCIESVVTQTARPHEIVLYDDGSNSVVVSTKIDTLVKRHAGLARAITAPNRGVCAARNAIIESFTGDAFVLLDSDDTLDSRFIESCVTAMRARPAVGAVATWTEFFGGYEGIEAKPPFDARVGLRENPIVSTAVLVDMSVWTRDIAFAEDMAFLYCEDWHVWSQLVAAGVEFGLVPRPLVRHRVHPASGAKRRTDVALAIGTARATEPLRGEWVR